MARLLTVLGLIVVVQFTALFFIFVYPYLKWPDVDEARIEERLAEYRVLADELIQRSPDDHRALCKLVEEVPDRAFIHRSFFKEICQKNKQELDEQFNIVAENYQLLFGGLDLILKDGLLLRANIWKYSEESESEDDSLCGVFAMRTLSSALVLAAISDAQNDRSVKAKEKYDRVFFIVKGLLDCPTKMNTIFAGSILRIAGYGLLYSLPQLDPEQLIEISKRLEKFVMPTKALLEGLKLDAVNEADLTEAELLKLNDEWCAIKPKCRVSRPEIMFCILPERLQVYLIKRSRLIYKDLLLSEIDRHQEWIDSDIPNEQSSPNEQKYKKFFFEPFWGDENSFFERARNLELTLPAVIQAIELEIKRRDLNPKPIIELPIDGRLKIIINEEHGCLEEVK